MAASARPLILVRGFGGPDVGGVRRNAYQGFNEGTVYPGRRGENYIYEGFVLRALKSSEHPYRDATNVVGYYSRPQPAPPGKWNWDEDLLSGSVVLDPATADRVLGDGVGGTLWVYRYYDLEPRTIEGFGAGLVRLIDIIRRADARNGGGQPFRGVDIVAHSMGGLVVRAALRQLSAAAAPGPRRMLGPDRRASSRRPEELVHRIVTLGTPHRGIAFQVLPRALVELLPRVGDAADELAAFGPASTEFRRWRDWFPVERVLTVVGTDHRAYGVAITSAANRLASLADEGSAVYNRSDGLVKQAAAQLPGAPRTFVHKCHDGPDSLITSREAFEISMRFLHGTHRVRLWLDDARVRRGKDFFGRSEFFFGVSVKPRGVDFDLFHQSAEAENTYGPFHSEDLSGGPPPLEEELSRPLSAPGDATSGWAGPGRLIWEGWVDRTVRAAPSADGAGVVLRLDVYLGERDSYGVGFSDNVVFRKQYYVQLVPGGSPVLYVHTGEQRLGDTPRELADAAVRTDSGVVRVRSTGRGDEWRFSTEGTGFTATLRMAFVEEAGPTGGVAPL
ncbi:esterase/lipase family protein [Streptomyces sp. NPDC057620]|uniref:esterase/lipase family protein n=1 Tax=Streptomyces sp. NPDC057620 TaxID=3346185 RepID=UPI0036BB9301